MISLSAMFLNRKFTLTNTHISFFNPGTSPQDIVDILQKIATSQKINLITMEPLMQKSLSNPNSEAKTVMAACDLVDAFRGARVAPELTSKIILLQKAIETGIISPEKSVQVGFLFSFKHS